MVMSLRRKMALRRQAADAAAVRSTVAGLSRAGQVSRSTVPVEDADIPVVETLEQAAETAETLPGVVETADQAGSDAYEAAIRVNEAQAVAEGAAADALAAAQAAAGATTAAADAQAAAAAAQGDATQAIADAESKSAAAQAAAEAYARAEAEAAETAAKAAASDDATAKADAARAAAELAAAADAKNKADAAEAAAKADAAAAQATADAATGAASAAQDAANSVRFLAEGLYQAIPSVDEPTSSPTGALKQGDMWMVIGAPDTEVAGKFVGVQVWDGVTWMPRQMLADSILVVSEDGTVRIADNTVTAGAIAADALDFVTARGAQLYGGYIEAPTIASSDKLGSGANVLADPGFTSSVNTAWVASGHLGDAAVTQRDTITWDQTWMEAPSWPRRAWGNVVAEMKVTRGMRTTGHLTMPNYSWLSKANRTLSNPFNFTDGSAHNYGLNDPTFRAVASAPLLTATARTTYLTNSVLVAVESGQRWNIRFDISTMLEHLYQYVSAVDVEIVNSTTGAVVHAYRTTDAERRVGHVNTWWDCGHTGTVRYRIKATYTAGGWGDLIERTPTAASYARGTWRDGSELTGWYGTSNRKWLTYGFIPSLNKQTYHPEGSYVNRVSVSLKVESALFAQVEPKAGWRVTELGGVEMFDSLGAKTVNLDGQDNFLTGRLGTAESGARWELEGTSMTLFNEAGTRLGAMSRSGTGVRLDMPMSFQGDTDWASVSAPGATGPCQWRRLAGIIYLQFDVTLSTAIPVNGAKDPLATLPATARPIADTPITLMSQGSWPSAGMVNEAGGIVFRNLHTSGITRIKGSGNWPANS